MENITERLEQFLVKAQAITESSLEIVRGRKYAKIVEDGHRAYCFVDLTNGNILKPASWKAPITINPRGNIFDTDFGCKGLTKYGCVYLRG